MIYFISFGCLIWRSSWDFIDCESLILVNFQHLTVVTLLQKLQPVFAIILARILLKEIIEKKFIFWSCVALLEDI